MSKRVPRNESDLWLFHARRLPARLSAYETALLLGIQPHDVSVLTSAGILKPLGGKTKDNTVKYFAAFEIESFARDRQWLEKMTRAITRRWYRKNHSRNANAME